MSRQEIETLYEELKDEKIDILYFYSCLLSSGFNKDNAFNLIYTLKELWLKDEYEYTISKLSDMLFNIYEDISGNLMDLTTNEILELMYESEGF